MYKIKPKIILSAIWLGVTGAIVSSMIYFVFKPYAGSLIYLIINGGLTGAIVGSYIWWKFKKLNSVPKSLIIYFLGISVSTIFNILLQTGPEGLVIFPFVFIMAIGPQSIVTIPLVIFSCIALDGKLEKYENT